jgi:serine/threonine protein kinase
MLENAFNNPVVFSEQHADRIYECLGLNSHSLDDNQRLSLAINACLVVDRVYSGQDSNSGTPYAHLDIKPENFVMDENGNIRLVDFGFAHDHPEEINAKPNRGTLVYMPDFKRYQNGLTRKQFDMVALRRTLFMPVLIDCSWYS